MARSKTPFGIALGCGCAIVSFALIVVFVGGILTFVFSLMKNSEPYKYALAQVQVAPQAVAALGEPIEPGWFLTGNINLSGSSGNADISIPVKGPNGRGTVNVLATKSGGVWTYNVLRLTSYELYQPLDLLSGLTLDQAVELPSPPESP